MNPRSKEAECRFVVATPQRSVCDHNARALHRVQALRFIALGARRGTEGIPKDKTRLHPLIGLCRYATGRFFSMNHGESLRYRLNPWFDQWTLGQLQPGDHVISSYGYANACFQFARANGGKTFLDGGNSHPEQFWTLIQEEHRRWNCPLPPVGRHHYERSRAMMEHVDFVLSPSQFVAHSFLERGFKPEQILRNVYPVDLSLFQPAPVPRPANRPFTIISTGTLTLRKGTPYLLEAFRQVLKHHPSAKLKLVRIIHESVAPILAKHADLPIDWSPPLPHAELVNLLRSADLFVLPSLEEGMVRTALEAMACGLPVILTPHCGANDLVTPGQNGEVVPIRDSKATAQAILKWADHIMASKEPPRRLIDDSALSVDAFEREFLAQLSRRNLLPGVNLSQVLDAA